MKFIKKVGKLAKLVIYSQDVGEARPQSAFLAAAREGNPASPPSHVNSQQPVWTSPYHRPNGSQCPWTLAMWISQWEALAGSYCSQVMKTTMTMTLICPQLHEWWLDLEHSSILIIWYHRTNFFQSPSSLNLREAHKNHKLCHFLHSCWPYFPLTFSSSISFSNFSLFSKVSIFNWIFNFQLLATTSDSLVVTTFVTVSEPFLGDSPQLATSKYEHKNWITDKCHKRVPCGTWVYNDTGWGFTPGIIAWKLRIIRKWHDYIWQYVHNIWKNTNI